MSVREYGELRVETRSLRAGDLGRDAALAPSLGTTSFHLWRDPEWTGRPGDDASGLRVETRSSREDTPKRGFGRLLGGPCI